MDAQTVVQRYLVDHDPAYIADDAVMVDHGARESVLGADAIGTRLYEYYNVFFPGAEARVRHLLAAGDTVTLEMDFVGRNDGPFLGRPPTGREVHVPMCVVYKLSGGKITSIDVYFNALTMMEQLGMSA